tara:strand:- start:2376 stop:2540 length:165 start_codon:yes stop_codon:yes gene_type:complete
LRRDKIGSGTDERSNLELTNFSRMTFPDFEVIQDFEIAPPLFDKEEKVGNVGIY